MSTPDSLLLAACGNIMLHNRYQALADAGNAAQSSRYCKPASNTRQLPAPTTRWVSAAFAT